MRKHFWIFFSFLFTFAAFGQSKITSHTNQAIVLDFKLPEIDVADVMLDQQQYVRIEYDQSLNAVGEGLPIVPYTLHRIALPPEATVTSNFEIISQKELVNVDLLPAQMVNGLKSAPLLPRNESVYQAATPFPGQIVEVGEPYTYQRMRMVDIKIYPVQYHPAEKRVRLIDQITIRLNLKGSRTGTSTARLSSNEQTSLQIRAMNYRQAANWVLPRNRNLNKTQTVTYDFSSNEWYKIPVNEEGIYKITGSFLQSQNITISSIQSATIQVFGYGGAPLSTNVNISRPADLNEVAVQVTDGNGNGVFDADDAVYFYASATRGWRYDNSLNRWTHYLNPYADTNYYLFTFNQNNGKRIETEAVQQFPTISQPDRFTDLYRFEEENNNILESGIDWYWLRFSGTTGQQSVSFDLPENVISDNAVAELRLKGGSKVRYWDNGSYTYTFDGTINGQPVFPNEVFTNQLSRKRTRTTNAFTGGTNTFDLAYGCNQESCVAYLDYLEVRIERPFIAENGFLKFYYDIGGSASQFDVSGLPAGSHRVWDVTAPANVANIAPLQNGNTVRFQQQRPTTAARAFYVFAEAAVRSVETIERIPNSPNLRDPQRKGKLLLIVSDELYDAAEAWEDFKETRVPGRIETERIKVSEIFREFSSGLADPTAIRDFIKYAYENWSVDNPEYNPFYIQILGDGSYDYRNIELTSYTNQVPVFEITANDDIASRVTDNYFTAINNISNGLANLDPQLPIARYPANNEAELNTYLNKMTRYYDSFEEDENANGWQTLLTFVADDECAGDDRCNEWFHLSQTEKIIREVPTKFDLKKIYLVDYETQAGGLGRQKPQASSALLDQINRGTLMINFFGHGDPNTWAHEQVLTKARDLPLIRNGAKLPIWIAATCTWGKYDDPNTPSMAEEMVWAPNGGGIASIAASRPSFAFENEQFAKQVYRNLFNFGNDVGRSILLGDAVNLSVGGGDNDQKYHLFGDVTLRLADPEHTIKIESISQDTLKALSQVSVNASVYDANDNPMNNFNGKAVIRVLDAVDSTSNLGVDYNYPGGTIFKGIVTVANGKIEDASFIVPKSIKYKDSPTGRISIYAWSENQRDAVGYNSELLFLGTQSQVTDTRGPSIDFAFPNQPDFFDGDFVGQQPTIEVELSDESGINLTGEVGHRIELTIDNTIKKDVTEFFVYYQDEYTEGRLTYTLPALEKGRHELKISAWDNLNNYSEETIFFTTTTAEDITLAQVINYPNPLAGETHFTFQYQSPNGSGDATVKIYTVSGRLIQEINDIARPGFNKIYWDGRDRDGDELANGVYIYKIVVDDGEKRVEKIEKMAVVR